MRRLAAVGLGDLARALKGLRPRNRATRQAVARTLGYTLADELPRSSVEGDAGQAEADGGGGPSRADVTRPRAHRSQAEWTIAVKPVQSSRQRRADPRVVRLNPLAQGPSEQQPAPLPLAPLFSPQWTRGIILALVRTWTRRGPVDVRRLTEYAARRLPIRRVPRLRRPVVRDGLHVLIDVGDTMAPFARDEAVLTSALQNVVGREATAVFRFVFTPLQGVWREGSGRRRAYVPPPRGVMVVVISDLGIAALSLAGAGATTDDWLTFVEGLERAGCPTTAIVPYPPDRWPASLAAAIPLVTWDRTTHARSALRAAAVRRRTLR